MSTVAHNSRITPFLWFDNNAEEAARFYTGIFPGSRILETVPNHTGTSPATAAVLLVHFELDGTRFTALNGGPQFPFNESISFVIHCATQEEIDYYWERLIAQGGSEVQCGWLKDKYGISWQVVPAQISQLARSRNAMLALMRMKKLDIAALERAAQE